ncbi:hypothetical protein EVG20_g9588, partial [Dentipellis fragilis]
MVHGSMKRMASKSPERIRQKRRVSSSPEEGEVDDGPPTPSPRRRSPSPPAVATTYPSKVKFPFKKKPTLDEPKAKIDSAKVLSGPSAYERPEVDERRQGNRSRVPPLRDIRGRPVADHWEPSSRSRWDDRAESRERDARKPRERERNGRDYDERPSYERDYERDGGREYERRGDRSPVSSTSSRHRRYDDRERDRSRRRSPSPASPDRRSYTSSSSSTSHKGKHRLPPARLPRISPSPPRDYLRDRERERSYPSNTFEDDRYSRNADPYNNWADRDSYAHYHRSPLEDFDSDRNRRGYSPPSSYRDRERPGRRNAYEPPPRRFDYDYRPVSPRASSVPRRPPDTAPPERGGPYTPPPPTSPPPPPPPADAPGNDMLPPQRTAVSIALPKKPPAPKVLHSPTPLGLPRPSMKAQEREREEGETDPDQKKEAKPEAKEKTKAEPQVTVRRRKREPVHRTREEEQKAYGRQFIGCGRQEDYDATTKLGEGTFGEVHKAVHRSTNTAVALKRILMHNEKEGMPVTALREIKILKALNHPNVVELLDMFVVRSKGKDSPLSVYMVFPYMDHDLAGLLENERVKLSFSQIKLYMKQLLEGTEYMHRNHILHRDMKAANLLISNNGSLRIADFGLARSYDPHSVGFSESASDPRAKSRKYTNCVVTRWYRPPELLLGARHYGGEIDLWGVGCVLGEMFLRRPILPGTSDLDQLEKIWQMCGTPNQHSWPNFDMLPGCEGIKHHHQYSKRLKSIFEAFGTEACDLIDKLLTCNPRQRITASEALDHDYFWTEPLPADPRTLPSYEASHEFDKRGRRHHPPAAHQLPLARPQEGYRPMPPPMGQNAPPYFNSRGPPPTRESFRAPPPMAPNF